MPDSRRGVDDVRALVDGIDAPGTEPGLDRVCVAATRVLNASAAAASLLSADLIRLTGSAGLAEPDAEIPAWAAALACARVVAAGAPCAVDDVAATPDLQRGPGAGSDVIGAYLGVPLCDQDGVVRGALCVLEATPRRWTAHDLTRLEQLADWAGTELALKVARAGHENDRLAWRLAVDAAGVGAFEWDLTTGRLQWDARLLEVFGVDEDSFGGTIESFNEFVHPEDLARVTAALSGAITSCGEYAADYRVVRPNGETRWISARGRALADQPDGAASRVLGAAYDSTAARADDARVARVLESMPTAFFQLDGDWRFSFINSEAERLLEVARADVVGGSIWELFPAAVGSDFETYYRGAVETGEPVTFDAFYPPPLDAWYEVRAWPSPDGLSVYFVDITARLESQRQLDHAARRAEIIAASSDALSGTLDPGEGVSRFATILVPRLADWCVVTLVEEHGSSDWRHGLRDVGWSHADPSARETVRRYTELRLPALTDDSFVARSLSRREPLMLESDAADQIAEVLDSDEAKAVVRALDPASGIIVPLRGRDRTVGVLSAFRGHERNAFTAEDQELLADLGTRAGLALDNARLYAGQRDLAEALQRSLMTEPPQPDHLRIAVRYQPAAEATQVGGDWYDAFLQPHIDPVQAGVTPPSAPDAPAAEESPAAAAAREERLDAAVNAGAVDTVVAIGDVVGHDVEAAAAMGQIRGLLRGIAVHSGDGPAGVIQGLDAAMAALQVETTATAVVARIDHGYPFAPGDGETAPEAVTVRWTNAGHPPPLLVTGGGEVAILEGEAGSDLLLGLDPGTERREHTVAITPGSTLLLYTDGLVERRGQDIDEGITLLADLLRETASDDLDLDELCDVLLARLIPAQPEDDVALLAVRLTR